MAAQNTRKTGQVADLFSKKPTAERPLRPIAPPDVPSNPPADPAAGSLGHGEAGTQAQPPAESPDLAAQSATVAPAEAPRQQPQPDEPGPGSASVEAREAAAPEPGATPEPKPRTSRRKASRSSQPAAAPTAGAAKQGSEAQPEKVKLSFHIPESQRTQMIEEQQRTKANFTDIILDAIALNLDEIKAEIASTRPAQRSGGLFARTYTQRPVAQTAPDVRKVQVNIFLFQDDAETFEQLVVDSAARDKSHLVRTALTIRFGKNQP